MDTDIRKSKEKIYSQNLESLVYISVSDSMGLSSFKFLWWAPKETQCVMALQVHPRSLILTPIESAHAISYWSSIVTLVYLAPFQRYCRFPADNYPTPIPPEFQGCSPWTRFPMLWLRGAKTLS